MTFDQSREIAWPDDVISTGCQFSEQGVSLPDFVNETLQTVNFAVLFWPNGEAKLDFDLSTSNRSTSVIIIQKILKIDWTVIEITTL